MAVPILAYHQIAVPPSRTAPFRSMVVHPAAFRRQMEYFSHSPQTAGLLAKLAATRPQRLACMHGSAWEGDGAALLDDLRRSLGH